MSDLVVSVFDGEFKAEEVWLHLRKSEAGHMVDLDDSAVLIRKKDGKVELHHVSHFTVGGAVTGGFWGTVIGALMLNPLLALMGLAAGAVVGGVAGSMSHIGIDEDFMKDFAEHLEPGTSALCILVREHMEKVREELEAFGGKHLQTPLLRADEEKLRAGIDEMKQQAGA